MLNRIILKLSGEALANKAGSGYNETIINEMTIIIKRLTKENVQVGIVIGGGNFWRGRDSAPEIDRNKSDQIGMLATVMNGIFIMDSFRRKGVNAKVLTPFIVGSFTELYSADLALNYLNTGNVVIFAGGIGSPYFSTDTVTALRAAELKADAVLLAKNGVDCVYDDDPNKNVNAKPIRKITFNEVISNDKLSVMDNAAACICKEADVKAIIFGMDNLENIYNVVAGCDIGTLITK